VTFVVEEIESQPAVWLEAASLADGCAPVLPAPGARVVFLGCGTSLYVAQALAALRESAGQGESDAFPASEMPIGRDYELAVALSRSGTTTEVLELVDALAVPVLAITADADGPLARRAEATIAMPFADEQAVVQTRFATATLALFRAHFGERLDRVSHDARLAIDERWSEDFLSARQIVYLGRSWSVGLAHEAALKAREAAQAWSEAYPAMEYRHGPIAVAEPGTIVWSLDRLPDGLADEVQATGARLVRPAGDPMAELVRAQRFAVALAQARGLDPDRPRHLTRSVVLQDNVGGR
jgi:fructoselysine-6-P-deglycase FrlB-like protein